VKSPLKFLLLVLALSIPFWLIGGASGVELLPRLPVSALMAFCPVLAASILVYRENKTAGVMKLLKRSFDCRRIRTKLWYAPILLLMPGVMLLTYALMRLMGLPLPTPQFPGPATLAMMFLGFFVAGLGEELGWSGYAIDPMQDRWNALQAGVVLGVVGAAWHIIPLLQAHRSPGWIAWWGLNAVALRVLTVWLYNNTGKSVFAAVLFHAIVNLSTFLFPNYASHWNPRITGLITACAAAIVTTLWGPRALARYRNA